MKYHRIVLIHYIEFNKNYDYCKCQGEASIWSFSASLAKNHPPKIPPGINSANIIISRSPLIEIWRQNYLRFWRHIYNTSCCCYYSEGTNLHIHILHYIEHVKGDLPSCTWRHKSFESFTSVRYFAIVCFWKNPERPSQLPRVI